MMEQDKLSKLHMSRKETIWGFSYLVFEMLALPTLLMLLNLKLPHPMGIAAVNFAYFGINFITILLIFHRFLLVQLRYTLENKSLVLLSAAIGFLYYFLGNLLLSKVLFWLVPDFSNVNDQSIAIMAKDHMVMMATGTVLLVPIVEEVLHRGLIFGKLRPKSRVIAYLLSACVFSSIHVVGYIGLYDSRVLLACFLQYLPAGLSLAYAYERSGSLFAPVLMHTLINAIGIATMR